MTMYATRGEVLDRFLTDHDIDPDEVLSVSIDRYGDGADIRMHVYDRVPGLTYTPTEGHNGHFYADILREDLTLRVIYSGRREEG